MIIKVTGPLSHSIMSPTVQLFTGFCFNRPRRKWQSVCWISKDLSPFCFEMSLTGAWMLDHQQVALFGEAIRWSLVVIECKEWGLNVGSTTSTGLSSLLSVLTNWATSYHYHRSSCPRGHDFSPVRDWTAAGTVRQKKPSLPYVVPARYWLLFFLLQENSWQMQLKDRRVYFGLCFQMIQSIVAQGGNRDLVWGMTARAGGSWSHGITGRRQW